RDRNVTGVQTCALPILICAGNSASLGEEGHHQCGSSTSRRSSIPAEQAQAAALGCRWEGGSRAGLVQGAKAQGKIEARAGKSGEIGRASCREREERAEG